MYEKFLKLLIDTGKTPYQVSKETNIPQSTLSDWKRGKSNPKVDKLLVLAEYFNVPVGYFLEGGAEEPK